MLAYLKSFAHLPLERCICHPQLRGFLFEFYNLAMLHDSLAARTRREPLYDATNRRVYGIHDLHEHALHARLNVLLLSELLWGIVGDECANGRHGRRYKGMWEVRVQSEDQVAILNCNRQLYSHSAMSGTHSSYRRPLRPRGR